MSKIQYINKRFNTSSRIIIGQANTIIEEYNKLHLILTLRQLYYQFVSRDLIANTQKEYKRLVKIITNARLAGLIDWEAIEDRTRALKGRGHWKDPGDIIRTCMYSFHMDKWINQKIRPEVWIEKEALTGVISNICSKLDVDYFACKGYVSISEMWKASQRYIERSKAGQQTVIIHLGDHDPSGIDMTRDIDDRHSLFEAWDCIVERIALNMDQVEEYKPPPNPTKMSDARSGEYVMNFGKKCWELDALEPTVLQDLIEETILKYRDQDLYDVILDQEVRYSKILMNVEKNWETL